MGDHDDWRQCGDKVRQYCCGTVSGVARTGRGCDIGGVSRRNPGIPGSDHGGKNDNNSGSNNGSNNGDRRVVKTGVGRNSQSFHGSSPSGDALQ